MIYAILAFAGGVAAQKYLDVWTRVANIISPPKKSDELAAALQALTAHLQSQQKPAA
jgi:hypothetical protein